MVRIVWRWCVMEMMSGENRTEVVCAMVCNEDDVW